MASEDGTATGVAGASDRPIRVVDAPAARRYEAYLGESPAGFAEYRLTPGRITFIHTVVDPAFEGRGVGSALVRGALADARGRGLSVIPICPFFKAYLRRHPEVADIVLQGPGDRPEAGA
jgi:hypothetical protein